MDKFVIIDVETFGLDAQKDPIIEIAVLITSMSPSLHVIDSYDSLVWIPEYVKRFEEEQKQNSFVYQMHEKSGLWADLKAGPDHLTDDISPLVVEADLTSWLHGRGVTKDDPMTGSSIQFDREMLREQMPAVESCFSHRNIDISTLKELCRRLNPELFSKLDRETQPQKAHRAFKDVHDTLGELQFYVDNFLFVGDELF